MLYRFLKIILGIGIRLYYREVRIKDKERLSQKGAKIIIANHPNTLMDAWIIGQLCKEPIYFLTKGTFFNSKWKTKLLMSLGMIPINRATDGKTSGVSNMSSFEQCYQVLEQGKTLVVFPEGNSFLERQLRELKSGTARIALELLMRGKLKDVTIIPVGLIYTKGEKFRSSVLGFVGENIDVKPYLQEYTTDSIKASKKLTEDFRVALEKMLIQSASIEQEQLVDQIVEVLAIDISGAAGKELERNIDAVKQAHNSLNQIYVHEPWKISRVEQLVRSIRWRLNQLEIGPDILGRKKKSTHVFVQLLQSLIMILFGFPLFFFGAIHNILPYQFTSLLMPKMVRDIEYYAPIAILIGIVIYPLTYTGFLYLGTYLFDIHGWWKLIYLISMPISGLLAFRFIREVQNIAFRWNYLAISRSEKDKIQAVTSDIEELKSLIF